MLLFSGSFYEGGGSLSINLSLFKVKNPTTVACRAHFAYNLKVKLQYYLHIVSE